MDINDLRAAFSVIMFIVIIGIYVWAWSKKRARDFNEAANLPFTEPEQPAAVNANANDNSGEKL